MDLSYKRAGILFVSLGVTILLFVNYYNRTSFVAPTWSNRTPNQTRKNASRVVILPVNNPPHSSGLPSHSRTHRTRLPSHSTTHIADLHSNNATNLTTKPPEIALLDNTKYNLTVAYAGRLGNLMFETASGYGIAVHNKRQFAMPGDDEATQSLKSIFEGLQQIPIQQDPKKLAPVGLGLWGVFQQASIDFKVKNSVQLHGYIQSFKYFHDYQEDVRKLFTFSRNLTAIANAFISNVTSNKNKTIIGIHVRRGDYLWPEKIQFGYILPSGEYFRAAMEHFRNNYSHVMFVVISDDLVWCKNNINDKDVVYGSTGLPEGDLCALTLFDHVILSVGTFSWWAGYLNRGEKVYFRNIARAGSDYARDFNPDDFFPNEWIPL